RNWTAGPGKKWKEETRPCTRRPTPRMRRGIACADHRAGQRHTRGPASISGLRTRLLTAPHGSSYHPSACGRCHKQRCGYGQVEKVRRGVGESDLGEGSHQAICHEEQGEGTRQASRPEEGGN